MQGISSLVVTLMILIISIALVSVAYIFATEQTERVLGETEWVLEKQRTTGLSGLRIEAFDIDNDIVTMKNTGKNVLTYFNVYVDDVLADITAVNSINPTQTIDITINDIDIDEGNVVKITTAEGVYAIEVVPYTGQTCLDGTPYGECSIINKPYYCDLTGGFNPDCNHPCPCPVGTNTCLPFGDCTFISFVQLSGFWTFNESSGTNIQDSSGEGIDGTLGDGTCTEGSGSCPSWVVGLSGNALLFDGVNDYAGFGDNFDDLANASSGSFLWWTNFIDNTSAPGTQRFWGKDNNYEARWLSGGTPRIHFDVGQTDTVAADISFEENRWYHLAFTWNATGTHFYVDGSVYATGMPLTATTDGGLPQSSNDFRIGEGGINRGSDNNFAGIIDEFQIWNRTLSDSEVYDEYQKYAPSPPEPSSDLVGFWAFDGDTTDSSGNGNDGTNFGATWTSNAVSGQALTFDGGIDYVEIPFHESLQVEDGDFTIAAWVNGIDNQKAQNIYIVALYDDFGFRVAVGGNDNLGMWFRRADSSTGGYNTGNQVLDDTWHYIAVTKNGNTYTFYDNGQYVDDTTLSQALIIQSNVRRIGSWSPTYGNFNGIIDEVKIWNRSLSGSEINNEFNQYTPPVFIDANFESDVEGFTYLDDLYFGTSNPAQESGQRESNTNCAAGQCLAVNLNLESVCSNCGPYSGGWENSFTVINPTAVGVSFDYTLRLANPTEFGEYVNITSTDVEDGLTIVGEGIEHNNPGSDEYKSGTFYYSTGVLSPASYTFNAGCHLSQVSFTNENAECWVDNVLISSVSFNQWGALSDTFNTGTGGQNRMRCMGGTAPSLSNMIIDSLHMNFSVGGSAAMAVYFGGSEGNPTGATKKAEVIGQTVTPGWYTFDLESNIVWPSDQVTWVCWKLSGATATYYSNSNAEAGDFFTTHGRHNETNSNLNPNLPFVNALTLQFSNYWYPVYVTYYEQ